MTPTEAIRIIARQALSLAGPPSIEDEWENYPDIGESDWEAIVHEADAHIVVPPPTEAEHQEAYALLSSRALHKEEDE